MLIYVTLLTLSLFCLASLLILVWALMNQLRQKDRVIQDLLNRVTSGDLKAYQIMSRMTSSESDIPQENPEIIPMSDEAEVKRLIAAHGLEEPIWDEATDPGELREFLGEMGVDYGANPPN